MKKLMSLLLTGIAITNMVSGYPQKVHQHIVTQAKGLLVLEYPHINFSTFNSYIGPEINYGNFNFIGNSAVCESDWRDPYINAGAWREDSSNPYFTDWNNLANLFNSHFWNSNAGDNSYGLPMGSENYPNAYQKAMTYVNGEIEFDLWYGENGGAGYVHVFPYALNPTQNFTTPYHHGLRVKINTDLPTFHKDGIIEICGYYQNYTGSYCPTEGSDYVAYQTHKHVIVPKNGSLDGGLDRDYITMQLLGRIAHLLMDVSVPAHAHLDDHICPYDSDYYEQWTGAEPGTTPDEWDCDNSCTDFNARQFTAQSAHNAGGIIDMRNINNPIRYLFYLTDQIALHYPCGNPNGEIDGVGVPGIYGGDNNQSPIYDGDNYSILESIPGILDTPPSTVNPQSQGEVLMNWAIRATASLFYWFMVESEMIDEVECKNWAYMTTVNSKFKITDQTTGTVIADDINPEEKKTLSHAYDYTVKTKQWDPGYNSLWHYCWNNNQQEYRLKHDFTSEPRQVQTAYFVRRQPVTLNSNCGNLLIQDPWFVNAENEVRFDPPVYQEVASGSNYPVFLDQNPTFEDNIPIYHLKAPAVYATASDIMVFDRWQSPSASAAVFNEQGATTTTNRETDVVFKSANATVTAQYVSANASDINILISAGETVQIPAGGHYISQFDPNKQSHFGFSVFGSLTISGTAANPVIFETADINIWEGIKVYPRSPASQVNLNHCIIKDAAHIIEIREDPGTVVIDLNKCVIADS